MTDWAKYFDQELEKLKKKRMSLDQQLATKDYKFDTTPAYPTKPKATQPSVTREQSSKRGGLLDTLKNIGGSFETAFQHKMNEIKTDANEIATDVKKGQYGEFAKDLIGDAAGYIPVTGHFIRGAIKGNDNTDKSLGAEAGQNFTAGIGDLVKGVGDVERWLSNDKHGIGLSKFAEKNLIKPYEKNYTKKFGWNSLLDPEFYATEGSRALPFMLSMLIPGAAEAKAGVMAGEAIANAAKMTGFAKTITKGLISGLATVPTAMTEASFEAAQTYDQAKQEGHDDKTAHEMANKTFKGNMVLLEATEAPEFSMMFAPFLKGAAPEAGVIADALFKRIAKTGGKIAGSAALEGGQEYLQQGIQDKSSGKSKSIFKPADMNSALEQGALGAIMGGGMTGITHAIDHVAEKNNKTKNAQPENADPFHEVRQALGNADPQTIIANNVLNRLSDELKSNVDDLRDNLQSEGRTPEEIHSQVMDAINNTEEGKSLIEDETQRLVERLKNPQAPKSEEEATQQAKQQEQPQEEAKQIVDTLEPQTEQQAPVNEQLRQDLADAMEQVVTSTMPQQQAQEQPKTQEPTKTLEERKQEHMDKLQEKTKESDLQKGDTIRHSATGHVATYLGTPNAKNNNLVSVDLDGKVVFWNKDKIEKTDAIDDNTEQMDNSLDQEDLTPEEESKRQNQKDTANTDRKGEQFLIGSTVKVKGLSDEFVVEKNHDNATIFLKNPKTGATLNVGRAAATLVNGPKAETPVTEQSVNQENVVEKVLSRIDHKFKNDYRGSEAGYTGKEFAKGDTVYSASISGAVTEGKIASADEKQYTVHPNGSSKNKFFVPFGVPMQDRSLFHTKEEAQKVADAWGEREKQRYNDFISGKKPEEPKTEQPKKEFKLGDTVYSNHWTEQRIKTSKIIKVTKDHYEYKEEGKKETISVDKKHHYFYSTKEEAQAALEKYIEEKKVKDEQHAKEREKWQKRDAEIASKWTDSEALDEAVFEWVRPAPERTSIMNALEQGEMKAAKKIFHSIITTGGYGHGTISVNGFNKKIEIKLGDGRVFHPSEADLFNRFARMFKEGQFYLNEEHSIVRGEKPSKVEKPTELTLPQIEKTIRDFLKQDPNLSAKDIQKEFEERKAPIAIDLIQNVLDKIKTKQPKQEENKTAPKEIPPQLRLTAERAKKFENTAKGFADFESGELAEQSIDGTGFPGFQFKKTKSRVEVSFVPKHHPVRDWNERVTWYFPITKDGVYTNMPYSIDKAGKKTTYSVADVNDQMNMDYYLEGNKLTDLINVLEGKSETSVHVKKFGYKSLLKFFEAVHDGPVQTKEDNFLKDHVEIIHVGDNSKQETKTPAPNNKPNKQETEAQTQQQPPKNVTADKPKTEPTKFDKAHAQLKWLDDLADRAEDYWNKNKGRSNALPLDLYAVGVIMGARKMAHGAIDFAQWSEEMIKHYGEELRLSLKGLYAQSEAFLNDFSHDERMTYLEQYGVKQLAEGLQNPDEVTEENTQDENLTVEQNEFVEMLQNDHWGEKNPDALKNAIEVIKQGTSVEHIEQAMREAGKEYGDSSAYRNIFTDVYREAVKRAPAKFKVGDKVTFAGENRNERIRAKVISVDNETKQYTVEPDDTVYKEKQILPESLLQPYERKGENAPSEIRWAWKDMKDKFALSGKTTAKHKVKLLEEMKEFADKHGFEWEERYKKHLDNFRQQVENEKQAKADQKQQEKDEKAAQEQYKKEQAEKERARKEDIEPGFQQNIYDQLKGWKMFDAMSKADQKGVIKKLQDRHENSPSSAYAITLLDNDLKWDVFSTEDDWTAKRTEEHLKKTYHEGAIKEIKVFSSEELKAAEQSKNSNTGYWMEKPEMRSASNFRFTPDEAQMFHLLQDKAHPAFLKAILGNIDHRLAYDVYLQNKVSSGREVLLDSKDFYNAYEKDQPLDLIELRKELLGFGQGLTGPGRDYVYHFQVTMTADGTVHVVYAPDTKQKSEDMSYQEFEKRVENEDFVFGKTGKPIWLDNPAEFLKNLRKNGGAKLVSNNGNSGTVSNGKTTTSVPGNEKEGESETVSSSNTRKPNGTTKQPNDGEPGERASGEELSPEHSGDRTEIQDTPRDINEQPIPVDHVITQDIYESGKKTRFNNNINALKLLKTLQQENREASADERATLAKYQGWGGLPEYFDKSKPEYFDELAKYVDDLFTQDDYHSMSNSTLTSFYTNYSVASEMYRILKDAGFEGGRILEPSVGTGMFIGAMPEEMKKGTRFTTVEKDRITHLITRYLYPKQNHYHTAFEKKSLAKNSFDVVIGNVPFGNIEVIDRDYKDLKETNTRAAVKMAFATKKIHNYFLVRSMDLLRPGGIGALITSTGTMDSTDEVDKQTRAYLQENADILEVVRMPNGAFKDAGTDVASDIIFFRKKVEGSKKVPSDIRQTVYYTNDYHDSEDSDRINLHLKNNPEFIAGTVERVDDTRFGRKKVLRYLADGFAQKFKAAVKLVVKKFKKSFVPFVHDNTIVHVENAIEEDWAKLEKGVHDGAVHLREGKFYQYTYGKWTNFHVKDKDKAMFTQALALRDTAIELRRLERDKNNKTESFVHIRERLNKLYDGFVKVHGNLNKNGVLTPLEADRGSVAALRALEQKANGKWEKIDLFFKRMQFPDLHIDVKGNIHEAISVSLANRGELDLFLISELMNMTVDDTIQRLEKENLVFFDPEKADYVTADEYLSGDIPSKLQFVQGRPELKRNEDELQRIMPVQLTTDQVTNGIRFGQQWIPFQVYEDFIRKTLKITGVELKFNKQTASWDVKIQAPYSHENRSMGLFDNHLKGGGVYATEIIEKMMNQKSLKATLGKIPNYMKPEVEQERLTNLLRHKGDQLLLEFKKYILSDEKISNRLTNLYNRKFNSIVLPTFDGEKLYGTDKEPKNLPGLNPKYKPYKHQKDATMRILQQQNALLAHVVGAGKTLEMQMAIMEGRRLGIIRKPVLVVPSFMVEQHSREFKDAYPDAKIKVLGTGTKEGDLSKVRVSGTDKMTKEKAKSVMEKNRMSRYKALADVMYQDYDVVIMTYESFERMPVSPEYEEKFLRKQIDILREAMQDTSLGSFTVKEIEHAIDALETRIAKSKNTEIKDTAIPFEELGFDALFVDEAHNFKNLLYHSKMGNIAGLSNSSANRSLDMYMKTSFMNETGAKTVFATGTPIANSVAEMYTMLRYLAPKALEQHGMEHFDAWAAQFGTTVNSVELNTSGKFVERTRFSEFMNVPELMNMFKAVADVKMAEDLPYLKRPEVERETVTAPMSDNQKSYLELMVKRAENMPKEAFKDNMLKLTGEGKKIALDYRIIDGFAQNEKNSKLNLMAEHIAEEYFATKTGNKAIKKDNGDPIEDENGNPIETFDNGTQLVFMDLGVPKASDSEKKENEDGSNDDEESQESVSMYQNLKDRLLELGVKPNEIAFIHDYKGSDRKKLLSDKFNKGEIRIIIGSTGKMGVGMNLQRRLTALHHADPTWRPADIEQREGRIVRQGNWNPKVKVKTYVTEGSFDALMWGTLENKAKFIAQVMSGDTNVRTLDEIAEMILSYTQIKAEATNNEAMKKLLTVEKTLRVLKDLAQEHAKDQADYANALHHLPRTIAEGKKELAAYLEAAEQGATDIDGDKFIAELDGVMYSQAELNKQAEEKKQEKKDKKEKKDSKEEKEKPKTARQLFREALTQKLAPIEAQESSQESSNHIATIGGLDLRLDVKEFGKNINGNIIYQKRLSLQYKAKNGEVIQVYNDILTQALEKDMQGAMIKIGNALRNLTGKHDLANIERGLKWREESLKEAQEKGNQPFPQEAEYEKLLNEVADLREEARRYELTNANDTVFQRNGEYYVVIGVDYRPVPSKNKKKQAEDKADYVVDVIFAPIKSVEEVEYEDENGELRTVNVFKSERMILTESNGNVMRDIEFLRDYKRDESISGITEGNFRSRLKEIERIKKEREEQAKQDALNAAQNPPTETGIEDETPSEPKGSNNQPKETPKEESPANDTTQQQASEPVKRRIKGWNPATVQKVNVGGKDYWTVKTSVSGNDWAKFSGMMKSNGGTYHKANDPVPEFRTRFTFEKNPESIFVSDSSGGAKAFKVGQDTIEHSISPKTAKKVTDQLARALKTVLRPGGVRVKGAAASFEPYKYSGNIKNKWLNDIRVSAHELGHAFEEQGFMGNEDELLYVAERYYPGWDGLQKKKDQLAEGRAELFTLFMINPSEAADIAPDSVDEMNQIIDADPVLKKVFAKIHETVAAENDKGPLEKAIGSIAMPSQKRQSRNIGDEYALDNIPEGAEKWETRKYKVEGFIKRRLTEIIDFKIPWNAFDKALNEKGYSGKSMVKTLALTGNAEGQARESFEGWARDRVGRYIIRYESADEVPEFLHALQGELEELDPRNLPSNSEQYELMERYSSFYKKYKAQKGLNHEQAKQKAILDTLSSRSLSEIAQDGMLLIAKAKKNKNVPEQLKKAFEKIANDKEAKESPEFQSFAGIIQAYRAQERYSREDAEGNKKFKEVYMSEEIADQAVEFARQNFPGLEDLIKEYTSNLSNIILTKSVDAGVITQQTRDNVEAASDFYIPTYYADKNPYAKSKEETERKTAGNPIHHFKGQKATAVDFLRATTYKLLETEQSIEFKQVLDEVEKGVRQEGMGVFGEILSPQQLPEYINGASIAKQVAEVVENVLGDTMIDIDKLEDSISNQVFMRFFPVDMLDRPILMNWHEDAKNPGKQKRVFIRLAPDLYNSIKSMKPIHVRGAFRFMSRISSITRHLAITNPRYIWNVLSRDFFSTAMQKNTKDSPANLWQRTVKGFLKGAALSAGVDPLLVDQYITSGAFMSAQENVIESMKRANISDGLINTKIKGWKRTKAGRFVHIFSPENVLRWQEQINRYGVWEQKARELAAQYGINPKKIFDGREALTKEEIPKMEKILLELGYEASEVTTNFRTHGTSEGVRKAIMPISFLHGSLQGIYREMRELKENPMRLTKRGLATIVPVTVLMWAALQALDPDDKDDITSEMRDKYWILPVGNHYMFFAKPFFYTIVTDHMERMLDNMLGGEGARKWNEDFFGPEIQNFKLPFLPIWGQTMLDLYANKAWYGGDIVANEKASKFNQIDSKSSKLAEGILKTGYAITGKELISPDKFDYAMRGFFGGPGQAVSNTLDTVLGKPKPILSGSQINFTSKDSMSSRITDKYYKSADDAELEYQHQIMDGKAEKGKPTPKVKAYRELTKDLSDMRKLKEVAASQKMSTAERDRITKSINNAIRDMSRYGTGLKVHDPDNLTQVMDWVEQYRKANK